MVENFKVVIVPESYVWENGKIDRFGDIHIKLEDFAFPSEVWNDFGSDIVYWWMESFLKILNGGEKKAKCSFMDGNYRFDISIFDSSYWTIRCIRENADKEEIWHTANIEIKQAIMALISSAREFQGFSKKSGEINSFENYELKIINLSQYL